MLKFQLPSKYSLFDAIHLLKLFSTAQTVLNSWILMPLSASAILVSPLPHQQNNSLWGLFSPRETKRSLWVRSGGQGGCSMGVMPFLVKSCWTLSAVWAGALVNRPPWNGQPCRNSEGVTGAEYADSHHASWNTDTDGSLGHSLGRETLYYKALAFQKIIPVFWGSPLVHLFWEKWKNYY